MAQKRKKRATSYIAGEKGTNRVRLFPQARDGKLYLEFRDEAKRKKSVCLGHDDWDQGKQQADELALKLRQHEAPTAGVLTLKALFDRYEREKTVTKGTSAQGHDRRARLLFEECWGSNAKVSELDQRDWDRFIQQRRSGALKSAGDGRKKAGVRDRVIEFDLRFMYAVCKWATTIRERGKFLLDRHPFQGFTFPKEKNSVRPIVTADELVALEKAATEAGSTITLFFALVKETGHRCPAVSHLRWSDVDLGSGQITWRGEHDKLGRKHTVPLSKPAIEVLTTAMQERKSNGRIGDGWMFPSPDDDTKPVKRPMLIEWWRTLERRSKIERQVGRGWHSLRRFFATELQHTTPLKVIQELGGWRDHNTILKCYTQADSASMRQALDRRSTARAIGQ